MESKEELKKALISIIDEIKSGTLFDSHYIIEELLGKYPGIYESNMTARQGVARYHGFIARKMNGIPGIIKINDVKIFEYENKNGKFLSPNIRNRKSHNQLWVKFMESVNVDI